MLALHILTMHQIITLLIIIKFVSMENTIRYVNKHVDETKLPIKAIMNSNLIVLLLLLPPCLLNHYILLQLNQ